MVFVIVAAGGYVLFSSSDSTPGATTQPETAAQNSIPKNNQSESVETPGSYVAYSDEAAAKAKGTKLLFFHAPWCPQCRALEADINKNGAPDGTTIFKVDYDSAQELRQKYGVTLQTTVVLIDDEGKLVKKFVANDDPTLAAVTGNLL